jgi:hypothetical protein
MHEQGDHAAVLELYDTRFRDLAAPLTVASPDVYIDVQNAASMLFRLQRHGVDVGNRWDELADKAEARIGDCCLRVHAAALADGADRHRPHRRCAADDRGDARLRQGSGTVPRSCATTCCRSPRPSSPTPPDATPRPSR